MSLSWLSCCRRAPRLVTAARLLAVGAVAPVDDLGFVDDEPVVIGGLQARPVPHRAVDVDGDAAAAADEVVVVVVDPVLVASRRARRLDAPDESLLGQDAEGVVDRLARDGPISPRTNSSISSASAAARDTARSTARRWPSPARRAGEACRPGLGGPQSPLFAV